MTQVYEKKMQQLGTPSERLATLVPMPRSVRPAEGSFALDATTTVVLEAPAALEAALLGAVDLLPIRLQRVSERRPADQLHVRVAAGLAPPEGYRLDVRADGVAIEAADASGMVYAIQTLRQLMSADAYRQHPTRGPWELPAVQIEDSPRFAWRGALIDVARHFLPKHALLRQIDLLAAHKINRIQLHLTDDQGWRIESELFPRLHEVGSVRAQTQTNHADDPPVFDGTPHGGYYTREDLREIVAFARQRAVTIVPEITVPGHVGALLAAYPEFGSPRDDRPREVIPTWGVHEALLSPLPHTFEFLDALIGEALELFDSPWLHVGADEALLEPWAQDDEVRRYAVEQGLHGPGAVFTRFLEDLERIVRGHGRTMIAWDDGFAMAQDAPPTDTTALIMAWRGEQIAQAAARAGRDLILAPVLTTYFDFGQADDEREPISTGGPVTLADAATWQPIPVSWTAEEAARVVGVQCQMWSELTPTPRMVDYMLYPRAAAFAEVAWADTAASLDDVAPRLRAHLARLAAAGVEFRPWDGPAAWQVAGSGRRAHRRGLPIAEIKELMAEAADVVPSASEWPAGQPS